MAEPKNSDHDPAIHNSLPDTEKRFRALLEHSADAISLLDAHGIVIYESPSYQRIMGHSVESRLGRNTFELVHPDDLKQLQILFDRLFHNPEIVIIPPVRVRHSDGTWHWIEGVANNMLSVPEVGAIVINFRDITERKHADLALRESETRMRLLSDNLPGGMVYQIDSGIDGQNRQFTYLSAGVQTLHGVSPEAALADAAVIYDQIFEEDRPLLMRREAEAFADLKLFVAEVRIKMPSGDVRWSYFSSSPRRTANNHLIWDGIEIDITEKKKLLESALRADKMEAIGLLAGGIAHDFNNLLGGIYGNIDLALTVSKDLQVSEYLGRTKNSMARARALTQQLLTFSKGGAPIRKIDRLAPFLQETVQFALSGSNVSSIFNIPSTLWPCNFDKNQLGQVIDNLVINAQQAMPLGGKITVSAENIIFKNREHSPLPDGRYVKLSIEDHGIGIPEQNLSRIFDPFFTTKTRGHGLGLATCYSIVKRHEGCIEVRSELGQGSIFDVFLPASPDTVLSSEATAATVHKGTGIVIVMDDEAIIRTTVGTMLKLFGYSVESRDNGVEAIDFFKQVIDSGGKIAAMFFDLTVAGGMGGKEAIKAIRALDKNVPVFVASGYADDPVMANPVKYGFTASIRKPFTISELAIVLNNHFDPK